MINWCLVMEKIKHYYNYNAGYNCPIRYDRKKSLKFSVHVKE